MNAQLIRYLADKFFPHLPYEHRFDLVQELVKLHQKPKQP